MVYTTKSGKRISLKRKEQIEKGFEREYGKKRGKGIFYATFTKSGMYKRKKAEA